MKIVIKSINGAHLPDHYFHDGLYKKSTQFSNFFVGCERYVYGVIASSGIHYLIRLDEDTNHLSTFPAALVDVIDNSIPESWIVSHETKAMHRGLPDHQIVIGPRDWLCPYISNYLDRLIDGDQRAISLFLQVSSRDYPSPQLD